MHEFNEHGSPDKQGNPHLPLKPRECRTDEEFEKCLEERLEEIRLELFWRGIDPLIAEAAAASAVFVGLVVLRSGRAKEMTAEHRAGWLWTTAVNEAKREASHPRHLTPLGSREAREHFARGSVRTDNEHIKKRRCAIQDALRCLSEPQRQAILTYIFHRHSLRSAADALECSVGSLRHHLTMGARRLKEILPPEILSAFLRGKPPKD